MPRMVQLYLEHLSLSIGTLFQYILVKRFRCVTRPTMLKDWCVLRAIAMVCYRAKLNCFIDSACTVCERSYKPTTHLSYRDMQNDCERVPTPGKVN